MVSSNSCTRFCSCYYVDNVAKRSIFLLKCSSRVIVVFHALVLVPNEMSYELTRDVIPSKEVLITHQPNKEFEWCHFPPGWQKLSEDESPAVSPPAQSF